MHDKPNHLINEKSPYLLQHANNPVEWYPWSEEAFARATTENKAIFLSIGYSTCHWCHVMEHESFENTATAAYLNAHFICIKVDREERPDVDAIYMAATQAMTGSGGWPMSCFLTPTRKPFFCGTYFPPVPAHGRPSFPQLLERIVTLWDTRQEDILGSADELTKAMSEQQLEAPTSTSIEHAIESCVEYFKTSFDSIEGGFGSAPKFPRPSQFNLLFQYYDISADSDARKMALFTLKKMAMGGINDQLAGGFHRYAVDNKWFAPHFEKMLYDQAQLLDSYLDAYQISGDLFYRDVVASIADFVLSDMTNPAGGFYSALDADSEGVEGKYYVWTYHEIVDILGIEDARLFAYRFGISESGNWEDEQNILYRAHTTPEVATFAGLDLEMVRTRLTECANKLLAVRSTRIPPLLDDKILTPWNGLMISALARASQVFDSAKYLDAATTAGSFIWNELYQKTGNALRHRWRDGEAKFEAYLESFAFLIKGYLSLYETSFDPIWLDRAITLQADQDKKLFDTTLGGYFTSTNNSDLIIRTKNEYDGAEPSGNSVAVQNLFRLFTITGNSNYNDKASATIQFFSGRLIRYPYTMPELLSAAMWQLHLPAEIVVGGKENQSDIYMTELHSIRTLLSKKYMPRKVLLYADNNNESLSEFARSLATDQFTVYYCHNHTCDLPIHSAKAFETLFLSDSHPHT